MASSETRTSATLLGRLQETPADAAAWAEFVARYGPRIHAWCRRWGLQDADAQDVAQVVLQKLFVSLRTFVYDPRRSFRGWLKTVAHHAWRDFVAGRDRPGRGSGDDAVLEVLGSVEAGDDLVGRLDAEFEREVLEEAMAAVELRVEAKTWRAFRMQVFDERPGAEIAAALGMSVAAVYMAKKRVQDLLKREIARLEGPKSEG